MTPIRRVAAASAAIAIAVTAAVTATPGAAQAAAPARCASLSVCGFVDHNYGGNYEWIPSQRAGTTSDLAFPNRWSSFFNNSGRTIRLYTRLDCTGDYRQYSNGSGVPNVTLYVGPTWNDNVECVRFY